MLVGGEAFGGREPDELDAFLLGIGDLALRPRHILAVAAIEAFDRLRALADSGADAVHRGVAAAEDDDMIALSVEATVLEGGNVVDEALAVRCDQVMEGENGRTWGRGRVCQA